MSNFLVVGEDLIFMRKYFWCQRMSWHFWVLRACSSRLISFWSKQGIQVNHIIEIWFFEFWSSFLYLTRYYINSIKINSNLYFFAQNSSFLGPEELLRLFTSLLAFFVFESFLAKLLCSCEWKGIFFLVSLREEFDELRICLKKHARIMRNSRSNLGFVRILACRLDIICLRHVGLDS